MPPIHDRGITSVQQFSRGWADSPASLADAYFRWLDHAWGPIVRVRISSTEVCIHLLGVPVIRLAPDPPSAMAASFRVVGGALARPGGLFTFMAPTGSVVFELVGFLPALPRWIYQRSHGPMHVWTMRRFARTLNTMSQP